MTIKIKSTKGYGKGEGIKCLIYSAAGMGKTRLCATAPDPFIISCESGLLSIADFNLPYIEATSIEKIKEVYEWIKHKNEYKTVCLDSISEIGETVLNQFKKTKSSKGTEMDARNAYGKMNDVMTEVIRNFRDLKGKNVYFSAKLLRLEDNMGVTSFVPSMPGKQVLSGMPYFFDLVAPIKIGQLKNGKKYKYLQTEADFQYEAKDRSGKLNLIEKPDLTHIFNKILKGD